MALSRSAAAGAAGTDDAGAAAADVAAAGPAASAFGATITPGSATGVEAATAAAGGGNSFTAREIEFCSGDRMADVVSGLSRPLLSDAGSRGLAAAAPPPPRGGVLGRSAADADAGPDGVARSGARVLPSSPAKTESDRADTEMEPVEAREDAVAPRLALAGPASGALATDEAAAAAGPGAAVAPAAAAVPNAASASVVSTGRPAAVALSSRIMLALTLTPPPEARCDRADDRPLSSPSLSSSPDLPSGVATAATARFSGRTAGAAAAAGAEAAGAFAADPAPLLSATLSSKLSS